MKTIDLIATSFKNLWRRKLRTFLTVLGVIIGTSSIVIMLSLGLAMNKNLMDQLGNMGSLNIINVSQQYNYDRNGSNDSKKIDDLALQEMLMIEGVEVVSPIIQLNVKMGSGRYYAWGDIRGVSEEMLQAQDIKLAKGRMPTDGDRYGFAFGSNIAYNFYNPNSNGGSYYMMGEDGGRPDPTVDVMEDPIKMSYDMSYGEPRMPGQKQTRPFSILVTGVIQEGSGEQDYSIYTTIEGAKKMKEEQEKWELSQNPTTDRPKLGGSESYENALVYVTDIDDVKAAQDQIKDLGYEAYSMVDYLQEIQNISAGVQLVLGGIGAVSLLVAALGITNTMIMSIYERTKEIGVMKVIGASLPDIKKMFLTEAAMIGFLGGVLGLLFSAGVSAILNYVGQNIDVFGLGAGAGTTLSVIPFWLYGSSVLFTSVVGLISGYFPARRAMNLSVLGALRNE